MSFNKTLYRGASHRLLSGNVWQSVRPQEGRDPAWVNDTHLWFDDFFAGGAALATNKSAWAGADGLQWDAYGTTGVTFATGNGAAGEYIGELVCTTDADNEEAYVSLNATYGGPLVEITDTAGDAFDFAFETRVKWSTIASTTGLAKSVGLINEGENATGTHVTATGAMSVASAFIGFRALIADADGMDAVVNDGTEAVIQEAAAGLGVIAADTYYKFGVRYDASSSKIYYYVDNVELASVATVGTTSNCPDAVGLVPFLGIRDDAGAGSQTMTIDWVAVGVRRVAA